MEENKVMNDDQLEEVVGGGAQVDFVESLSQNATMFGLIGADSTSGLVEKELMRVFAVHGLTPAQVFALSDEEKQKVIAELGLSSSYDAMVRYLATGHGMKEFQ